MCHIFSNIDPKRYAYETRSVRLSGHVTSIRLEAAFWQILEEIAASQDVSVGRLLTRLHDEVLNVEQLIDVLLDPPPIVRDFDYKFRHLLTFPLILREIRATAQSNILKHNS